MEFEAGNIEQSERYLGKAYRLSQKLHETLIRSDAVYKLAEIMILKNRPPRALRYADEAVRLNEEIGDPIWSVDSLILKSEILTEMEQAGKAKQTLHKAKEKLASVPKSNIWELERLGDQLIAAEAKLEKLRDGRLHLH